MLKYIMCSSRKYPVPPPRKGFFLTPPHPSGNSGKASYISLYFWIFQNPHPPGNSNPFCGGSMDIFWNCTIVTFNFLFFRELAFQISEQFEALGSNIGVKCGEYSIHMKWYPLYLRTTTKWCPNQVSFLQMLNLLFTAVYSRYCWWNRYDVTSTHVVQEATYCYR